GRRVWNGTVDKHPAVIVWCRGVADVMDAVKFAQSQGLPVSVRGGGHHVSGGSVIDQGLVIDLSLMRSVRVDATAGTVRAEGGATIGEVDRETHALGLAVPFGLVSATGVAGLTLAGGMGWLRRLHGLSSDNLLSADVVTAAGQLVHASQAENADLLWALRGGGWDLGVVTSFEYRAHPIDSEVMFVFTAYPMDQAKQVLAGFRAWAATCPEGASPILVFWSFPGGEPYPEAVWNKQFVGIAGPFAGPVEQGERILQPLRELATPMLDMSGPMSWTAVQKAFDEEYPNGRRYYWKSTYLRELSDAAVDELVALGSSRPSPLSSVDGWLMGGALGRTPPGGTAVSHREAPYLIGVESNWEDATEDSVNVAWTRAATAALAPYSTGGSYLNFEDMNETG
ncbi:MAG: FAD-binding oxidoreductase, partial [Chloroflexota bacterium]